MNVTNSIIQCSVRLPEVHVACLLCRYTGCGFGGPNDEGADKTKDCLGWTEGGEENACMKAEVNYHNLITQYA